MKEVSGKVTQWSSIELLKNPPLSRQREDANAFHRAVIARRILYFFPALTVSIFYIKRKKEVASRGMQSERLRLHW